MGELNKKLVHCYNRGCGMTFDIDDNLEESCVYHSGEPYFHDAYKEWTCCHKKTTDFTEFLSIKGCCQGSHNGNRPESLDKPKESEDGLMKSVESMFSNMNQKSDVKCDDEEIPDDLPLVALTPQISPRLVQQLSARKMEPQVESEDGAVPVGTPCKNASCGVCYGEGISSDCVHHPGSAIFHEGLKYWSCCAKKTTDFSKFLEQAGCTVGTHLWFKEEEKVECRMDWHQTGNNVVVSLFVKDYDPYKSVISLSPTRLNMYVLLPAKQQVFEQEYQLFSKVKLEESTVSMLPTKIEIKLFKALGNQWKNLWK